MIEKERYPGMSRIANIYPAPDHILGNDIYWTIKEDGSNIGIYLKGGELMIRSRNRIIAESKFMAAFKSIEDGALYKNVKDLLVELQNENDNEKMIFGELCFKGASPTRIETHSEHKFYMFDIAVMINDEIKFMPYNFVHQQAYHYNIPIVELVAVTKHSTMESLYEYKNVILKLMEDRHKEGVVGKVYKKTAIGQIFFKEKNDLPKFDKILCHRDENEIIVETLEESECMSEVVKAFDDTPEESWRNTSTMMPLIVEYIKKEAKRRYRHTPRNMFELYNRELIRRTTNE